MRVDFVEFLFYIGLTLGLGCRAFHNGDGVYTRPELTRVRELVSTCRKRACLEHPLHNASRSAGRRKCSLPASRSAPGDSNCLPERMKQETLEVTARLLPGQLRTCSGRSSGPRSLYPRRLIDESEKWLSSVQAEVDVDRDPGRLQYCCPGLGVGRPPYSASGLRALCPCQRAPHGPVPRAHGQRASGKLETHADRVRARGDHDRRQGRAPLRGRRLGPPERDSRRIAGASRRCAGCSRLLGLRRAAPSAANDRGAGPGRPRPSEARS